jgi:hypothetical protein
MRIDPMVKKAMAEAFAVVVEEFRAVTLKDSVVLESVGRQIHGVTGGQMHEFAQRLRDAAPRLLTEDQILEWADAHYERARQWPTRDSGPLVDSQGEIWANLDAALKRGSRGLLGNSSLAQLLAERRGVRNHGDLPPLLVDQILAWADAHYERTGGWPSQDSGPVLGATGLTWRAIHLALYKGGRGLPGGSSLAKLLAEHRAMRNRLDLSPLTLGQILAWADEHYQRTGEWPKVKSGPVEGVSGETWNGIEQALRVGRRGLPGGSSLAKLLAQHRDKRNLKDLPPLTVEQILAWADAQHERTGEWPSQYSGSVHGAPGETWAGVNTALRRGTRRLPGGSSLDRLIKTHRGTPVL